MREVILDRWEAIYPPMMSTVDAWKLRSI